MHGSFCALIKYIPMFLKKSYFIFPITITKGSVPPIREREKCFI